jgi:hypothetical protein
MGARKRRLLAKHTAEHMLAAGLIVEAQPSAEHFAATTKCSLLRNMATAG